MRFFNDDQTTERVWFPGHRGEAMNGEWVGAEFDALEADCHSLHEMKRKRKLDEETIAKCRRLERQLLVELERLVSRLRAAGVPIAMA